MISLICESKKQTNRKNKLIDAENGSVVPEAGMGAGGLGERSEGGRKAQSSRYKINKSWV